MDPRIVAKIRMRKERNRLERVKIFQGLIKLVLLLFFLALFFNFFIISIIRVDGSSMLPTFEDRDRLVFSKLNISERSLNRGEIVVFEGVDHRKYIKRILGLPGELVEIRDGNIFINGSLLKEDLDFEYTHVYSIDKWYLSQDEIFVIGDNRKENDSKDSRIFGPINVKNIEGKFLFEL